MRVSLESLGGAQCRDIMEQAPDSIELGCTCAGAFERMIRSGAHCLPVLHHAFFGRPHLSDSVVGERSNRCPLK
jgi:hypothetical protein